jgi:hypothetical protein
MIRQRMDTSICTGGPMAYGSRSPTPTAGSDWPAAVVAVGILLLLGAILVTATARWSAADVRDLVGTLSPVIGVVAGAFVTYFFTRQATTAATTSAQAASDTATKRAEAAEAQLTSESERLDSQRRSDAEQLRAERQRSANLHNALTAAMAIPDDETTRQKLRNDHVINAAIESGLACQNNSGGGIG